MTKGQQVEVLDVACRGAPEFCLVRVHGTKSSEVEPLEGLVPQSILKPPPSGRNINRRIAETDKDDHSQQDINNSGKPKNQQNKKISKEFFILFDIKQYGYIVCRVLKFTN